MPNMLETSAAWLGGQLQAAAGMEVTYTQRGATAIPLTAILAMRTYPVVDEGGVVQTSFVSADWTIVAADLNGLEPRKGDRIISGNGTYEVMPIDKNKVFHPLSDSVDTLLVVHSKRIAS